MVTENNWKSAQGIWGSVVEMVKYYIIVMVV